jgi:hypothetical protein
MTQKLIASTQQLFSQEGDFRVRGAATGERPVVRVDPQIIAGAYDYIPVDGTLPIDRMAQAQMFGQLMQQMGSIPQFAQQFDFIRMFSFMAKNQLGIKNLDSFRIQSNVVPNSQIPGEVQKGNLISMNPAATGAPGNVPGA